jgi:hypothetical protein
MNLRGPLLGVALAAALAVSAWLGRDQPPSALSFALSPQECNTECQRQQTDCVLACDGNLPCERRCTETGRTCVERCRRPADAGVSGGRGGDGGSGGRRRP